MPIGSGDKLSKKPGKIKDKTKECRRDAENT
jgi:hypothetical protein